jgi:hypothetical protein
MAVVDSRVRKGSLTIGGEVFSCQPTNVNIAPDHSGTTEDPVEVLCGDTIVDSGGQTLTANLSITAIQDFTDAAGFVGYSWSNDGSEQDFTWQPTDQAADAWSGKLTVQAVIIGGDVSARLADHGTDHAHQAGRKDRHRRDGERGRNRSDRRNAGIIPTVRGHGSRRSDDPQGRPRRGGHRDVQAHHRLDYGPIRGPRGRLPLLLGRDRLAGRGRAVTTMITRPGLPRAGLHPGLEGDH